MLNFVKYWALSEFVFLGKSNTPGWGTPFCDVTHRRHSTQHGGATNLGNPLFVTSQALLNTAPVGEHLLIRHRRHSTLRTLPSSPFRLALRTVSSQSTHISTYSSSELPTSSLVHHINYTKNTSLAFHPVIPRHVSVIIEPRQQAVRRGYTG